MMESQEGAPVGGDTELDADIFQFPAAAEVLPAAETIPEGLAVDLHATATILHLRQSVDEKDATIASLKARLEQAEGKLRGWRTAATDSRILPRNVAPEPEALGPAVGRLHARLARLQGLLVAGQQRESALHLGLSAIQDELATTRAQLLDCTVLAAPVNLQTQKLLLDPVVNAQYTTLKNATDALEKKVKELQDDLAAVQFTPHSKNGKMLMAKCRTLQEENEEIGREASEGKFHDLENKLALQKQLNAELKRGYQELQEYVGEMNAESERLQETVYKLQRQLQARESEMHEFPNKHHRDAPGMHEGRGPPPQYHDRSWDGPMDRDRRDVRRREVKRMRPERPRPRDDDRYDAY